MSASGECKAFRAANLKWIADPVDLEKEEGTLKLWDWVQIVGLKSEAGKTLNKKKVQLVERKENGSWKVIMDHGEYKILKPENLFFVEQGEERIPETEEERQVRIKEESIKAAKRKAAQEKLRKASADAGCEQQ
eukprot:TRINITY_DN16402_c0_g1_i1.p3 TRINITY_DN16402_c0_g1~~TRINITY_DN16402_c0_g1_i1.p3  ORF type:complete len:134 (+),score=51.60 TRINITY_DN16402_c0_g1_i1:399-800(+)